MIRQDGRLRFGLVFVALLSATTATANFPYELQSCPSGSHLTDNYCCWLGCLVPGCCGECHLDCEEDPDWPDPPGGGDDERPGGEEEETDPELQCCQNVQCQPGPNGVVVGDAQSYQLSFDGDCDTSGVTWSLIEGQGQIQTASNATVNVCWEGVGQGAVLPSGITGGQAADPSCPAYAGNTQCLENVTSCSTQITATAPLPLCEYVQYDFLASANTPFATFAWTIDGFDSGTGHILTHDLTEGVHFITAEGSKTSCGNASNSCGLALATYDVQSAPQIVQGLTDVTTLPGASPVFFVEAAGFGLNYAWAIDGQPAAGNGSQLVLGDVDQTFDGASVSVTVMGPCGSATSTATLHVTTCAIAQDPSGDIWWFGGADAEDYNEEVTLTATVDNAPPNSQGLFVISASPEKVDIVSTPSATQIILSTDVLDDWRLDSPATNVVVDYRIGGVSVCDGELVVLAPLEFVMHGGHNLSAGLLTAYVAEVIYDARDTRGMVLPATIEVNEAFLTDTPVSALGPGVPMNWPISEEGGARKAPTAVADPIQPPSSEDAMPTPVRPYEPHYQDPVMRFDGEWRVGSQTPGEGLVVMSTSWTYSGGPYVCTWEKRLGDATHK